MAAAGVVWLGWGWLKLGRQVTYITRLLKENGQPPSLEVCTNKIVNELTYPATTVGRVSMIFTDLAVIEVTPEGLVLKEVFSGLTPEDIQSVTEPQLIISPDLKEIEL